MRGNINHGLEKLRTKMIRRLITGSVGPEYNPATLWLTLAALSEP